MITTIIIILTVVVVVSGLAYHVTTSQNNDVHDVRRNAERTDEDTDVAMYGLIPLTERHQLTSRHFGSRLCDTVVHRFSGQVIRL